MDMSQLKKKKKKKKKTRKIPLQKGRDERVKTSAEPNRIRAHTKCVGANIYRTSGSYHKSL